MYVCLQYILYIYIYVHVLCTFIMKITMFCLQCEVGGIVYYRPGWLDNHKRSLGSLGRPVSNHGELTPCHLFILSCTIYRTSDLVSITGKHVCIHLSIHKDAHAVLLQVYLYRGCWCGS